MYDVLGAYRDYLMKSCQLRPETAWTYTNRLENLFEGQETTNEFHFDFSDIKKHE